MRAVCLTHLTFLFSWKLITFVKLRDAGGTRSLCTKAVGRC